MKVDEEVADPSEVPTWVQDFLRIKKLVKVPEQHQKEKDDGEVFAIKLPGLSQDDIRVSWQDYTLQPSQLEEEEEEESEFEWEEVGEVVEDEDGSDNLLSLPFFSPSAGLQSATRRTTADPPNTVRRKLKQSL